MVSTRLVVLGEVSRGEQEELGSPSRWSDEVEPFAVFLVVVVVCAAYAPR